MSCCSPAPCCAVLWRLADLHHLPWHTTQCVTSSALPRMPSVLCPVHTCNMAQGGPASLHTKYEQFKSATSQAYLHTLSPSACAAPSKARALMLPTAVVLGAVSVFSHHGCARVARLLHKHNSRLTAEGHQSRRCVAAPSVRGSRHTCTYLPTRRRGCSATPIRMKTCGRPPPGHPPKSPRPPPSPCGRPRRQPPSRRLPRFRRSHRRLRCSRLPPPDSPAVQRWCWSLAAPPPAARSAQTVRANTARGTQTTARAGHHHQRKAEKQSQ